MTDPLSIILSLSLTVINLNKSFKFIFEYRSQSLKRYVRFQVLKFALIMEAALTSET
jgi:hypothetical protein